MGKKRRANRLGLLLPLIALATACKDQEPTATAPQRESRLRSASASIGPRNVRQGEADFDEIASKVAGYAGHFISREGVLTAVVTDTANFGKARAEVASLLAAGRINLGGGRKAAPITAIRGDFSYQQLSDWRDIVSEKILGRVRGIIVSDLDEEHNRVTVGVLPGQDAAIAEARQIAMISGVPANALRFVTEQPMTRVTARLMGPSHLGQTFDTLAGGQRWGWSNAAYTPGKIGVCTIGFTADFGASGKGFISASHCSPTQWANDGADGLVHQNKAVNVVGRELYDMIYNSCAIPGCTGSRYSDAALFVHTAARTVYVGRLLRPSTRGNGASWDTTVSTSKPWLHVTGVTTSGPTSGATVDQIGASRGWAYGNVITTCADYWDNWPGLRQGCAYKNSTDSEGGDSGGPVFFFDGGDGVVALGLITAASGASDTWFSVWHYAYSETTNGPVSSYNIVTNVTLSGPPTITSASLSGASPTMSWATVTATNSLEGTRYSALRSYWNASTQTWAEINSAVSDQTTTSFTDTSPPVPLFAYVGTTQPASCMHYVRYRIRAYNPPFGTFSQDIYYEGDSNGLC